MIGTRAWWALMRRNLIYRKRDWLGTFFELALPIAFVAIVLGIKNAVENNEDFQTQIVDPVFPSYSVTPMTFQDYVTTMQATRQCLEMKKDDGSTEFWITGIPYRGDGWQVPFVKCDSRRCNYDGEDAQDYCAYAVIGVSGADDDDDGGHVRAEKFRDWLYKEYPALETNMPFDFDFVKKFKDPNEMDDYVKHKDYGMEGRPKLAMGIVWEGNDSKNYLYRLRQNSTNFNSPEAEWRPGVFTTPNTDRLLHSYAKDEFGPCNPDDGAPKQGRYDDTCNGQYMYNGVLTIQRLVGDFILEDSTGMSKDDSGVYVTEAGVSFAPFPTREYEESGFYGDLGPAGALLVTLGLLYPVAAMIRYITREKQSGQKELMKMMSVSESDIGWSWFMSFFLFHCIFTATITAGVSMALFENSNGGYLWLFWVLTFLSIIVFSMFLSTFTSMSNRAVTIGLMIFFIGVFLTFAVDFETGSNGLISLISLHPVGAFAYAFQEIGRLEDEGVGLQSTSVGTTDSPSDFTFNQSIQFLITDSIIWGVLTWYLNRVVKQKHGRANPLWFPFMKSYWIPEKIHPTTEFGLGDDYCSSVPFEPVGRRQGGEDKDIAIHKLRKVFKKTTAVDDLSLTMYGGQVTALLGHNGAGKTTTINILTGAMSPTDGYAVIAGKDIRTHMTEIRQDIGICPQHDCLFDQLTVREHIQFFARLKGLYHSKKREDAERSVDQALLDIALSEKNSTLAKNLSGGMKRKLSVAIAFCGGSSVVLLDEPTSGMDPFSRRYTWNVIRQYRENRCIILTTHFMDEADVLGDRIAIMSHGQLRCVGSPLFLKRTYGVGYQLTIEKSKGQEKRKEESYPEKAEEEEFDREEEDDEVAGRQDIDHQMHEIIKSSVPEANRLANSASEVIYQLPIGAASKFAPMFAGLDEQVTLGAICSYGVSITTMDEVFLAVARGDTHEKNEFASSTMMNLDSETLKTHPADEKSVQSGMDLEKEGLFVRHLAALFLKRGANFRRDKKAWLCTSFLPSLFVLIGFLIYKFAPADKNLSPLTLTLDDYNDDGVENPRNPIAFNSPGGSYSCEPGRCFYFNEILSNVTNENYYFCGLKIPENISLSCSVNDSLTILENIVDGDASLLAGSVTDVNQSSYFLYDQWNKTDATKYGAIFLTHEPASVVTSSNGSLFSEMASTHCYDQDGNYSSADKCERYGGYGYVVQFNFTAPHSGPLFQNLADESLARFALNDPEFHIGCTIDPLPITAEEKTYAEGEDAFMAWFLVVLSFPFIGGAFAVFVVNERESKAKHLQTVAGVQPSAYWLSTFIWDVINYQIPLWITIILMFIFDVKVLTTTERGVLSGVVMLLFFYGPAAASFSYCISFAFKSPSMCNLFIIISGFLIGMGGSTAVWILHIFGEAGNRTDQNETLLNAAETVTWILRFTPPFCLAKGLYNAIYVEAFDYWEGKRITVWTEPVLLVEVIFLACEAIVYLILAIYIDKWSSNPRIMSVWKKLINFLTCKCFGKNSVIQNTSGAQAEDDDIVQEEIRVLEGRANDDLIVINDLTKIYDNGKLAVNKLTFGIPHGECFGLLGINGAGKTTTLQLLTAEFPPTSGDAALAGYSVRNQPEKTRRRIGYCPQFDAHFENMTGREHVELYASIKGVPKEHVKDAAAAKLTEVGLSSKDCDRLSSEYSGGMKRRLSLACALIGEPQIVFLDECTTGVDPVARREIWQVISNLVATRDEPIEERPSIILTTHSMEECEALCPRIGIMAHGRLRCLGSAQHLKNKFGKGFQVEMKVDSINREDSDYIQIVHSLAPSHPNDEELAQVDEERIFFTLDEAIAALKALTDDDYLSSMISQENAFGFIVWKEATSTVAGCPLDELAAFASCELRIRHVEEFMKEKYPDNILRERQGTKVRYEIPSEGVRISTIFANIEENKKRLHLSDYGVSQTSLEQVFNMHAAEAERLKQGRHDD